MFCMKARKNVLIVKDSGVVVRRRKGKVPLILNKSARGSQSQCPHIHDLNISLVGSWVHLSAETLNFGEE